MPRVLACLGILIGVLFVVVSLSACTSPSAYAGVSQTPSATAVPAEPAEVVDVHPTEGPDPVATEYAMAALETAARASTPMPTTRTTPDVSQQIEKISAAKPKAMLRPDRVNGMPFDSFISLDGAVADHMREIFAAGQSLGRNSRAFSKAGDSTIEAPYFLGRFDGSPYNLGEYQYLQAVIDHYAGSYGRKSPAVRIGQHSWTLLNPAWADKKQCRADESPLSCEFRLNNPSVVILRLGANDAGVPKLFEKNMRAVVEYAIEQGVIPVLSTKPDQRTGTDQINDILRKISTEYRVPLWDFARAAESLPGRGLGPDGVHLTSFYPHDYTMPQAFQRGHGVQNLTALILLDKIRQVVEKQ